jgi:PAS domain S-box-containing protein
MRPAPETLRKIEHEYSLRDELDAAWAVLTSLPRKPSLFVLVLFLVTAPAWAQWGTPVIDGVITPGEYGNNNTVGTNTAQNWYMTWDATNLYVGITKANLSEGAVIYIGPNPQSDPKCCNDSDGNLTGFTYDNTNFASLPFRAKFVTYYKDDYREYRKSDGSGRWTGAIANYGHYASGAGNVREIAIPWSAINQNGGLPTHCVFFGYLTSSGGYVYGQVPNDNPGLFIGTGATYTQYYNISNTGNGPAHIEQVIADGKSYDASSGLRLPPLVRDLAIYYTGLSFVAPEKVLFRYKLEGWDRDWQNVGNRRQAFYTNLAPGKYRFRVTACNISGVWNEEGAVLDFAIDPAYWQTSWFRALCVVAFLALVYGAYRFRVRQLRRQEKKLRDVVETIPTFAWTALPDGAVDFVNHHWVEYTGLSKEKTMGSGWKAAVHPADLPRYVERQRASVAFGEPFEHEVRYRRAADEQYRRFLARAVPLRDQRGKILKWYGISTDIEDRKRAEEEREKLRADLAHVNRVSMLGELAASVSHELKQPIAAAITSANSCIEWLAHEPPNLDRARAAAGRIDKYGNRAAEIIDRIRSLYKQSPPQRELVEVNEIIREMVELLRAEANQYAVSIRTDLVADLPKITADSVQLRQVFMNLILNAIEAMKDSGGDFTVKSQLQDGQLQFSVSDTGVGLPAEKMDQIFSAFFTTKPQGSGMGLSISRSIVESHGGRLWATANDGRGATFHFTLPTAAQAVQVPGTGTGFRASSEEKSDSQSQ